MTGYLQESKEISSLEVIVRTASDIAYRNDAIEVDVQPGHDEYSALLPRTPYIV